VARTTGRASPDLTSACHRSVIVSDTMRIS